MAISSTAFYTTQTLAAAAESNVLPAVIDLNTIGTNGLSLELKLTNGASGPLSGVDVIVHYAFSTTSYTPVTDPLQQILMAGAQALKIRAEPTASVVVSLVTTPIPITARYLYTWVTHDTLGNTVTLDGSYTGIGAFC